jgi:hypothetical protein
MNDLMSIKSMEKLIPEFYLYKHFYKHDNNSDLYIKNKIIGFLHDVDNISKYYFDEFTIYDNTIPAIGFLNESRMNRKYLNFILINLFNYMFEKINIPYKFSNLPNEITHFLSADGTKSAIITNDLNKNNQQAFTMDSFEEVNFPLMCEKLSNIPIKTESVLNDLKSSVGFLEMYKVGRVEQLNILDRWSSNNPVNRRKVFDEACGISKYRYKKQEAERNLKNTKENLERINDIYTEIENQLNPLYNQSLGLRCSIFDL